MCHLNQCTVDRRACRLTRLSPNCFVRRMDIRVGREGRSMCVRRRIPMSAALGRCGTLLGVRVISGRCGICGLELRCRRAAMGRLYSEPGAAHQPVEFPGPSKPCGLGYPVRNPRPSGPALALAFFISSVGSGSTLRGLRCSRRSGSERGALRWCARARRAGSESARCRAE